MEILSEHTCQGWLEGYPNRPTWVLFVLRAFIHIVDSMFNQHAKWLDTTNVFPGVSRVTQLFIDLSCLAPRP